MNPRFCAALFLVTLTGFISLSYEIAWVRIYSFVSGSRPWAFGALLGCYLIGLALGSLWSLRFQNRTGRETQAPNLGALSLFVLAANLLGFLLIPLVAWLVSVLPPWYFSGVEGEIYENFSFVLTLPLVAAAAAFLGATLPLICHFSVPPDSSAGLRLSYLYLGNILGSGAGSLVTGFVLMDMMTIREISILLVALGLALSAGLSFYSRLNGPRLAARLTVIAACCVAVFSLSPTLFDGLYERLQNKHEYRSDERFQKVVESRFGVVTIDNENRIYGGGIFDGTIDTSLTPGSWMVRPYFISAVHPDPKEVLVIGLSGGAWTQILAHHPQVEKITVVEINAAYSERVIPQFDAVKSLIDNPKVEIVIDDARRWLRRNPERSFDCVVANATFHWREHATSLLSEEFMREVLAHLNPGGIYLSNATGSDRVTKTALGVFPDVTLLLNFILASNASIEFDATRWRNTLEAYRYDGKLLFDTTTEQGRRDLEETISILDTVDQIEIPTARRIWTREVLENDEFTKRARVITDDNLGHEFSSD